MAVSLGAVPYTPNGGALRGKEAEAGEGIALASWLANSSSAASKARFLVTMPFDAYRVLVPTLALVLASCGGVNTHDSRRPLLYEHCEKCSLNSGGFSPASAQRFREAGLSAGRIKSNPGESLAALAGEARGGDKAGAVAFAEASILAAQAKKKAAPAEALGLYLAAAEQVYPHVGQASPQDAALALYNHSCAHAAELMLQPGVDLGGIAGPGKTYAIRWQTGRALFGPDYFEKLRASDHIAISGFRGRSVQAGVGGALVGVRFTTPERKARDPFIPSHASAMPATAIFDFARSGAVNFRLHDILDEGSTKFQGRTQPLYGDFTAPVAQMMKLSPLRHFSFLGMFFPEKASSKTALIMVEPFRRDKYPVVLIHGLMSEPATWKDTYNDLMADPKIRERFQFWVFRYPTGYPFIYPAATFRQTLQKVRSHYDPSGQSNALHHMVLVGHSMGGLIASTQVRAVDQAQWSKFFKTSLEDLRVDADSREALRQLFLAPAQANVDRVIFVAVPHRGSSIAGSWVGKFGTWLIALPKNVLTLQVPEILGSATEMGRTFLAEAPTSITRLRMQDPVLNTLLERPIARHVTFHSIIGDRGKGDSPNSSDGAVKYVSSHLDRAASEKIVPAWHNAHGHPEAIAEINRILTLHARQASGRR